MLQVKGGKQGGLGISLNYISMLLLLLLLLVFLLLKMMMMTMMVMMMMVMVIVMVMQMVATTGLKLLKVDYDKCQHHRDNPEKDHRDSFSFP